MTKFRAKYNEEPDDFNAVAYDTIILLADVIDKYGVDRTAIRDGLAEIKDVPSVIYGKATFDPQTRRVAGARAVYLVVKDGQFVLWDGKKPTAELSQLGRPMSRQWPLAAVDATMAPAIGPAADAPT